MSSHPHRNNSDFQLRYFMAGSCYTPDGAWALLYGQRIDIENKIEHTIAQGLEREAAIARAEDVIAIPTIGRADRLTAQAEIIKANAGRYIWEKNLEAARNELKAIVDMMAELAPQRKYSHLPLLEANEAMQRDEWLGELMMRAENQLATRGTIAHDDLNTMRCHPDFKSHIVPHIEAIMLAAKTGVSGLNILTTDRPPLLTDDREKTA